jgi:hypothetical protein
MELRTPIVDDRMGRFEAGNAGPFSQVRISSELWVTLRRHRRWNKYCFACDTRLKLPEIQRRKLYATILQMMLNQ